MRAKTVEQWQERVTAWRASGQSAEAFSAGRGWAGTTLRWWASRLRGERAAQRPKAQPAATDGPVVRVARVVRAASAAPREARGAIVVEARAARVRIVIGSGAAAETVTAVLRALVPAEAS